MIKKTQAQALRSKLSPAFAGFVLDGDVSDRDVIATLLDLVLRGVLELDATPDWKINSVRLMNRRTVLRPFEQDIINIIFGRRHAIAPEELRSSLKEARKSIAGHFNEFCKTASTEIHMSLGKGTPLIVKSTTKSVNHISKTFPTMMKIVLLFFSFMYGTKLIVSSIKLRSLFVGIIGGLVVIVPFAIFLKKIRVVKVGNVTGVELLRKKYKELLQFLKRYPLRVQRLHNEFMPYAVAFGVDTKWMISFGLQPEPIAK